MATVVVAVTGLVAAATGCGFGSGRCGPGDSSAADVVVVVLLAAVTAWVATAWVIHARSRATPTRQLYAVGIIGPLAAAAIGLLCLLRLPHRGDDDGSAAAASNGLNGAVYADFTDVSAWGTWSVAPDGGIVHLAFIPNLAYRPQLAQHYALVALTNSQWAQEQLLPLDVVRDVRAGRR